VDLGRVLLTPGLVNAHCHLELSDLLPGETPTSFVDWLLRVMSAGPAPTADGERRAREATEAGVRQCLGFGVTSVGDISRFPVTLGVLERSPLRSVRFGEVTAMAQRRGLLAGRLAAATATTARPDRVTVAVSPHAPYSIEPAGYQACVAYARAHQVPLATHLAEFADDERDFLSAHAGPYRRLWDALAAWDEQVPVHPDIASPISWAHGIGLFEAPRVVLAHVNSASDADLAILRQTRAAVVYCPRTHAYFGHPPHPWRHMLAAGIRVAVGTDSTASSPDLNLLDDVRLLRRLAPDLPPATLWELATREGAAALGIERDVGALAPARRADAVAFPVRGDAPLPEVLDAAVLPSFVLAEGEPVPAAGDAARAG
jgi:cytosine/adenosine deaminase-related metal-dependent hydrolase